ncbi:flavodoxin family protein [[Eubacterium] cellulosolvens]
MKKAVIIYDSKTGNTEKVAFTIKRSIEKADLNVSIMKVDDAKDIDFFDYDLVCMGTPSYQWHPTKQIIDYLKSKFDNYKKQGRMKLGSPKVSGKNVLIFCTYSGPHTGINEAIPTTKFIGQFFEHLGFTVVYELQVLSEFHGSEERSTKGRMGDIRGKPTDEELEKIAEKVEEISKKI